MEEGILEAVPGAVRNGARAPRLPGTSNLSFPGLEAEALALRLDLEGFAVSVGSACSSGSAEPSAVLRAMGLSPERVASALRFTLGWASGEAETDALVERLPALVAELRALHPVG
jgi:cysteine desulfurase